MRYLIFFAVAIAFSTSVFAEKFYRHIPFNSATGTKNPLLISLKGGDSLIVNYDFSEKKGIRCTSNSPRAEVTFDYKGREKTAHLPVILQSDHVPDSDGEELADTSGQFTLVANKNALENKEYEVRCQYVFTKNS